MRVHLSIFLSVLFLFGCGGGGTGTNSNETTSQDAIIQEQDIRDSMLIVDNMELIETNKAAKKKVEEQEIEIGDKTDKISGLEEELQFEKSKYYYSGTQSELLKKGLIDKRGFLGMGKKALSDKISKKDLQLIDMSKTSHCVSSEIKRIYPKRDESSYSIKDNCLEILDSNRFWTISEILIIETK